MKSVRLSRPSRRDPARARLRLLEAATRLFAARGYDGVAVDEIVDAAKLNKRMVYHYFGSKEDLYLAAISEVFRELENVELQALAVSLAPAEQLRRLLAAYFDFLDTHPQFVRLLLWENLQQGQQIGRRPQSLSKVPFLERFAGVIDRGLAQGAFRSPVDRRHLAVNIIGLCFIYASNHFSLAASMGLDLQSPRGKQVRLRQATDLLLHGVLTRPTGTARTRGR